MGPYLHNLFLGQVRTLPLVMKPTDGPESLLAPGKLTAELSLGES